jgi:hypothetical protein
MVYEFMGGHGPSSVPVVIDRRVEIPKALLYPHYEQPGFRYGEGMRRQTIYLAPGVELVDPQGPGSKIPGLEYANSDTWAMGTDPALWKRVRDRAGSEVTAEFFELLVREEIGDPTAQLKHIVSGIDGITLHSYWDFGYTSSQSEPR